MNLTTDLHAYDREEDGHQAIVDPEMQGFGVDHRTDAECQRGVPKMLITFRRRGIRPDQRGECGHEKDNAADGFDMKKAFKVGKGPFGQFLGSR